MIDSLSQTGTAESERSSQQGGRPAPSVVRLLPSAANKLRVIGATVEVSDENGTSEDTGLLVGRVDGTTAVIEDLIRFSSKENFPSELPDDILGWYWASDNEFSTLSDRHVEFKNRRFRRVSDIFLLLKPGPQTTLTADCYAKSPYAPFSIDNHRYGTVSLFFSKHSTETLEIEMSGISGRTAPIFLVREPEPTTAMPLDDLSGPVLVRPDGAPLDPTLTSKAAAGKVSTLIWVTAAGILFATASVTFTSTYLRSSAAIAAIGRIQIANARMNLGMRVESMGPDLQLTWDHKVTSQGTNAVLSIRDAAGSHEINLDPLDLTNGSLVYHPASRHVVFELQLQDERGASLADRLEFGSEPVSSAQAEVAKAEPVEPVVALVEKEALKPPPVKKVSLSKVAAPAKRTLQAKQDLPEKFAELQMPQSMYLHRPKPVELSAVPPALDAANSVSSEGSSLQTAIDLPLTVPFDPAPTDINPSYTSPSYAASASPKRNPEPDIPRDPDSAVTRNRPSKFEPYVPAKVVAKFMPTAKGLGEVIKEASTVQLEIRIDKNGRVERARVVHHTGNFSNLVEEASVSTVKLWTFEPAKERGSSVDSDYTVVLHFAPRE